MRTRDPCPRSRIREVILEVEAADAAVVHAHSTPAQPRQPASQLDRHRLCRVRPVADKASITPYQEQPLVPVQSG